MIYDASFIIYVNYNGERLGLCKWVHEAVPDAEWKVAWFGSTSHCYVSVDENKSYDLKRQNEEHGFWYYKYEINAISRSPDPITESDMGLMGKLAQKILDKLEEGGFEAVIYGFDLDEFL